MGNGLATYYKTETRRNAYNTTDRYRFGGKELDTRGGLFHYDFGARHYDPMLPMFNGYDPMAEDNIHVSPLAYCHGNPVMFIDPTGMKWESLSDYIQAEKVKLAIMNRIIELSNSKDEGSKAKDKSKRVEHLLDSYSEINQMAKTKEQSFKFDKGNMDGGETIPGNPIVMKIIDSSDEELVIANSLHELKHGYDMWKKQFTEIAVDESNAYKRQYSYFPNSLPRSDVGGHPSSVDLVAPEWVLGIYFNQKYIYLDKNDVVQSKQKQYIKFYKNFYKKRKANLK